MHEDQSDNRREYERGGLRRADLDGDPVAQFDRWLGDAVTAGIVDATAMTLASVDAAGQPNARIVLLKSFDAAGFVFYTDKSSVKGAELADNNSAALLFYWRELERQVRIQGTIEHVESAEADQYFDSRPRDSRLAAIVSRQSSVVADRQTLEQRVAALAEEASLVRPERWGGYRLRGREFEFWQGRAGRLHDRFRYRRKHDDGYRPEGDDGWEISRLQP